MQDCIFSSIDYGIYFGFKFDIFCRLAEPLYVQRIVASMEREKYPPGGGGLH